MTTKRKCRKRPEVKKLSPRDRDYIGSLTAWLTHEALSLKQEDNEIVWHEEEIKMHREHLVALRAQRKYDVRIRTRVLREHNKWRRDKGLDEVE